MSTYQELVDQQIEAAIKPLKDRIAALEARPQMTANYLMALVAAKLLGATEPQLPQTTDQSESSTPSPSPAPAPASAPGSATIGGVTQTEVKP